MFINGGSMGKTIIVKNKNTIGLRRCLNCGIDISHKQKGAKYCGDICGDAHRNSESMTDPFRNGIHDYNLFKC